jgi:alkyl hydroperoxide reductase subunit F
MDPVDPVCGKPLDEGSVVSLECGTQQVGFCSAACREKYVCDPTRRLHEYLYELLIIGGGPAGLSAGIYAALAGLDTLFLTKSLGGQAWDSTEVLNYPGFEVITGPELVERFRGQLFDNLHLAHQICGVDSLRKDGAEFVARDEHGTEFRARAVLLTTGMHRRRLGIPGEAELRGKGVGEFHAIAAERFRDKAVVVVGGGNSACQAALGLAEAGAKVTLACRGYGADAYLKEKVAASPVAVYSNRNPVRIEGSERAEVLVVENRDNGAEEVIPAEAVFVEIGLVPTSDLVKDLVRLNRRGEVVVDSNCATGLPGLFAAGDVNNAYGKRILIAAGEGAKAVLAAQAYLEGR